MDCTCFAASDSEMLVLETRLELSSINESPHPDRSARSLSLEERDRERVSVQELGVE